MKARILVGIQFSLLVALYFVKGERLVLQHRSFEILSSILYAIGIVVLALAFIALRPSLRVSPIPRDGAPLIVTGIYRWNRHPMYVAVLLFGAGLAINHASALGMALWFLLFIDLAVKASYEDELLAKAHMHAHDYQSKTRGILLTKRTEKR